MFCGKSVILQANKSRKSVIRLCFTEKSVQISRLICVQTTTRKDFTSHKALDRFLETEEYNIPFGIVLDNEREVYTKDNVTYMPIYYVMCIERVEIPEGDCFF